MKKLFLIFLPLITLIPLQVFADSPIAKYKRCIDAKIADIEKPRTVEAYRDRGCRTDPTNWKGERDSCHSKVCWEAPPHNLIKDARVWSHSSAGSEHDYGETKYLPSKEFTTKICNSVHARSPSGRGSGRGWQKLSADVTLSRQVTKAERTEIEANCERSVLGS